MLMLKFMCTNFKVFLAERRKFRDAFVCVCEECRHFLFSLYNEDTVFHFHNGTSTIHARVNTLQQFIVLHSALSAAMWSIYPIT